jgi:enoyl-CoA hydratase/carnithine racemase
VPLVLCHADDGVGVLSFNRPDRHNALSDDMLAAWREELARLAADPSVRAIVLRGEGPSFSSGRDTAELGRRAAGESDFDFVLREQREALRLRNVAQPVIAALQGWTLGGSFELALHCDFRVAATDARVGFPEVQHGLVPDVGGTQVLVALAGPARAKRMILTGEPIRATTALDWGVVDEVVTPEALDVRALEFAAALAALPPTAVTAGKRLVDASLDAAVDAGLRRELRAQTDLFSRRLGGSEAMSSPWVAPKGGGSGSQSSDQV